MKRLVWLVLAVFCTALAQVQPVALPDLNAAPCSCCETPGACGMPDCALPPAPSVNLVVDQPVATVQMAVRRQAAQPARHASHSPSDFDLVARALGLPLAAGNTWQRLVSVPTQVAHCSWLV